MTKHAAPKSNRKLVSLGTVIVAGSLIATTGLIPSYSSSYDVDGQSLSFNSGKLDGSGSLVTQADSSESAGEVLGENTVVGQYVDYYNVITIGGQQIDARVKVTELEDSEGTTGTAGELEYIDEPDDSPADANKWINVRLDYENGQGNSYVGLQISFFTDLANSPSAVTLQNVKMSTYDLDDYQYVELNNFDRYSVATSTNLSVVEERAGFTRFIDTTGNSTSGADSLTIARATVEFDSVSVIDLRLGKNEPAGQTDTSSSAYELDFSVGQSWSGTQAAVVVNPALPPTVVDVAYSGPKGITQDKTSYCPGDLITLSGRNMSSVASVSHSAQELPIMVKDQDKLQFRAPQADAGIVTVDLSVPVAKLTLRHQLQISDCGSLSNETGSRKYASKLFSNYGGDKGELTAVDALQIETFLGQFGSLEKVTCLGSTSGVPAIATDAALATSRAENACDLVTSKFGDGVETRITYKTGVGVGQKFRSVRIFAVGTAK